MSGVFVITEKAPEKIKIMHLLEKKQLMQEQSAKHLDIAERQNPLKDIKNLKIRELHQKKQNNQVADNYLTILSQKLLTLTKTIWHDF